MSIRRIIGITVFGILFIVAVIGVMLMTSYFSRDNDVIPLPAIPTSTEPSADTEPDTFSRVEITRDNIRAVISEMSRPDIYSREIQIETFWENGQAIYDISANMAQGITSLRITLPSGTEKRIIVSADKFYIWYNGDRKPFVGSAEDSGDGNRTADEWQMLITYEEILDLDQNGIARAEYTEFGDEDCIFIEYRSPLLGYTREYYVSIALGLIVGAEEYDETGALTYRMTSSDCTEGEIDPTAFVLPDGTDLLS